MTDEEFIEVVRNETQKAVNEHDSLAKELRALDMKIYYSRRYIANLNEILKFHGQEPLVVKWEEKEE